MIFLAMTKVINNYFKLLKQIIISFKTASLKNVASFIFNLILFKTITRKRT